MGSENWEFDNNPIKEQTTAEGHLWVFNAVRKIRHWSSAHKYVSEMKTRYSFQLY